MARPTSPARSLLSWGFQSPQRAAGLLADDSLAPLLQLAQDNGAPLPPAFAAAADPDAAVLLLLRLVEASADHRGAGEALREILSQDTQARRALIAVLGASSALSDHLIAHPHLLTDLTRAEFNATPQRILAAFSPRAERDLALRAVRANPADPAPKATLPGGGTSQTSSPGGEHGPHSMAPVDALRAHYRLRLLHIAGADLTAPDPAEIFEMVAAALADIAGGALEAGLAVARAELAEQGHPVHQVRIAVIGMGKTGGRELNYISDVDVIYLVAPAEAPGEEARLSEDEQLSEDELLSLGTKLAQRLAALMSATATEPPLWPLDAALRPEGRDGPLVRTLASYRAYYARWAHSWEFQALLKARTIAGDVTLGEEFLDLVTPQVWQAVEQENFVTDAQQMRRRVESLVPAKEADRQIKLGRGGLRDVEFTVQLLQLVHGRADPGVRARSTLDALHALTTAGYVARDDAETMERHYRFMRTLEHRIQMHKMRRTHVLPTDEGDLRRLGRSLLRADTTTAAALLETWKAARREVRSLHESIFYRPLLPLTARLTKADVQLTDEAARARLSAIGFTAPDRAIQQINALTDGVSRRAAIQRQLLPVMLGWFAEGPIPDAGLLGFRQLSDALGTTHWYLKLLRDSGTAGRYLATALSHSVYVARELAQIPDAVQWLDDARHLEPRARRDLRGELTSLISRRESATSAIHAVRYVRRRELLRAALGDVLHGVAPERAGTIITPIGDLAIEAALQIAQREALAGLGRSEEEPLTRFLVIAMGRTGGGEGSYASDADVLFIHQPHPDAPRDIDLAEHATAVATCVRGLLSETMDEPAYQVDADLRPEGRQGPIIRTLDSYREYYERWMQPWERQALLRARVAGGDADLGAQFLALIDPLRYPEGGFEAGDIREIRRVKARMESERMPKGAAPTRHLKLGRGSLSDVEWTAQLLQAQHAGEHKGLRTTSTLQALDAAVSAELLSRDDCDVLSTAWTLATRVRAAIVLAGGRTSGSKLDLLPHEPADQETVARLLGYAPGRRLDLEEDYLRATRRARSVMERIFFA